MRYKKIKRITFSGISDRNIINRQQFAKKMIDFIREDIVIINIDETWIG